MPDVIFRKLFRKGSSLLVSIPPEETNATSFRSRIPNRAALLASLPSPVPPSPVPARRHPTDIGLELTSGLVGRQ